MTNETRKKHSRFGELLNVLMDHAELVSLEARFEARQALRRLIAIVVACVLAVAAFVYLQIALIAGLLRLGLTLGTAGLVMGGVYGLAALVIGLWVGRRHPKVGSPFEATRREIRETIEWIRKIFS
ncbi:MAG: phage holin family protein [Elusimicrobiota bacterium]|jgi:uncharacterized membrane protein YqjE